VISLNEKLTFIERILGKGSLSRNQKNFDVHCPWCDHQDKNKKKLVIRTDDDRWHCWTCTHKGKTLVPLIKKCGTKEQLHTYLEKYLSATKKGDILFEQESKQDETLCLPSEFSLLALLEDRRDPDFNAAKKYVKRRKIDEEDLWRYKIGFCDKGEYSRRIIIPSFDVNGKLNYFTGRSVDKIRMKYKNPSTPKISVIFNEINIDWKKPLVLCEGPFDLLKCGENATCLLGSDFDEEHALFTELVFNSTPVILALDGDMWNTKIPKIVKKLQEYSIDTKVLDTRSVEDPGSMTKKEFQELLKSSTMTFDWDSMFASRVNKMSDIRLNIKL